MKLATFLLVVLTNPWSISANPRSRTTCTPFIPRKSKDTALKLRGGGGLGPVSGETLAKTFGLLAIGDALTGAISPVDVWDKFGVTVEPGSKSEHYLGHGLASSAASLSVTSLLALFGKASTEEAVAYGFLTRGAFMTEMLLNGKYKELGVPSIPHLAIYLILLATSFSLLSGKFEPMVATKIISILLSGHGALLFLNPRIADDDETKKAAKIDGGYMFVSSLFTALLAFGMDAVQAMGFTAIACLPLFLGVVDLIEKDEIFGMSPQGWAIVLVAFIGALAYGMLN